MKKLHSVIGLFAVFLFFTSCDSRLGGGADADAPPEEKAGPSSAVRTSYFTANATCANGGIQVDTGIDDNHNGMLDPDEVDNTQYVCNGSDGLPGTSGITGPGVGGEDGLSARSNVAVEPAGGNCRNGGIKIQTGLDADSNGILAPGEIESTNYICNGGIFDWSATVEALKDDIFLIAALIAHPTNTSNYAVWPVGTGFAITPDALATNAHVIEGLEDISYYWWLRGFDVSWMAITNGAYLMSDPGAYYFLDPDPSNYLKHPAYAGVNSPDLGLLRPTDGKSFPSVISLASTQDAKALKAGQPIGTLGYPGELSDDTTWMQPIATFKEGTISALRPYSTATPASVDVNKILQHNFDTTPGTSGSPIFNMNGDVVAINNSGMMIQVDSSGGTTVVGSGSLGFGIRVDELNTWLSSLGISQQAAAVKHRAVVRSPGFVIPE